MGTVAPVAREEGLIVEVLDDELLIYDEERDSGHRLNRTAATVWRHCDGRRSVADLVKVLEGEIGELADTDLVEVTLDELARGGLLEGDERRAAEETRHNRRRFIRRVGVVGTAALALPIVHSLAAPPPAAAQGSAGPCYYCYCCSCPCAFCD